MSTEHYPHTLILIRHGQCEQDGDDPPLTPLGRQQADIVGNVLKQYDIDTIYTSTLRRATETTELITNHLADIPIIEDANLIEGVPSIPPNYTEHFHKLAEKRESFTLDGVLDVQERLDTAFDDIFQPADDAPRHTLVVCHGNVIRYLVTRVLAANAHTWAKLDVNHCSLTTVIIAHEAIQKAINPGVVAMSLFGFNDVGHLPSDMRTFV